MSPALLAWLFSVELSAKNIETFLSKHRDLFAKTSRPFSMTYWMQQYPLEEYRIVTGRWGYDPYQPTILRANAKLGSAPEVPGNSGGPGEQAIRVAPRACLNSACTPKAYLTHQWCAAEVPRCNASLLALAQFGNAWLQGPNTNLINMEYTACLSCAVMSSHATQRTLSPRNNGFEIIMINPTEPIANGVVSCGVYR